MHQMEEKKKIFRHFGDGEYDILAKCRLELKLDNEGNNILHLMAKYLDYDGFKELYDHNPKHFFSALDAYNDAGKTPAHLALESLLKKNNSDHSIIFLLKSMGANIKKPSRNGDVIETEESPNTNDDSNKNVMSLDKQIKSKLEKLFGITGNDDSGSKENGIKLMTKSEKNDDSGSKENGLKLLMNYYNSKKHHMNDNFDKKNPYITVDDLKNGNIPTELDTEIDEIAIIISGKLLQKDVENIGKDNMIGGDNFTDDLDDVQNELDNSTEDLDDVLNELGNMGNTDDLSDYELERIIQSDTETETETETELESPDYNTKPERNTKRNIILREERYVSDRYVPKRMINVNYDTSLFPPERIRDPEANELFKSFLGILSDKLNISEDEARFYRAVINRKIQDDNENLRGFKNDLAKAKEIEKLLKNPKKLKAFLNEIDLEKIRKEMNARRAEREKNKPTSGNVDKKPKRKKSTKKDNNAQSRTTSKKRDSKKDSSAQSRTTSKKHDTSNYNLKKSKNNVKTTHGSYLMSEDVLESPKIF